MAQRVIILPRLNPKVGTVRVGFASYAYSQPIARKERLMNNYVDDNDILTSDPGRNPDAPEPLSPEEYAEAKEEIEEEGDENRVRERE